MVSYSHEAFSFTEFVAPLTSPVRSQEASQVEIFIQNYRAGQCATDDIQFILRSLVSFIASDLSGAKEEDIHNTLIFLSTTGLSKAREGAEIRERMFAAIDRMDMSSESSEARILAIATFLLSTGLTPARLVANRYFLPLHRSFRAEPSWSAWQALANIAILQLNEIYSHSDAINDIELLRHTSNFSEKLINRSRLLLNLGTTYSRVLLQISPVSPKQPPSGDPKMRAFIRSSQQSNRYPTKN